MSLDTKLNLQPLRATWFFSSFNTFQQHSLHFFHLCLFSFLSGPLLSIHSFLTLHLSSSLPSVCSDKSPVHMVSAEQQTALLGRNLDTITHTSLAESESVCVLNLKLVTLIPELSSAWQNNTHSRIVCVCQCVEVGTCLTPVTDSKSALFKKEQIKKS